MAELDPLSLAIEIILPHPYYRQVKHILFSLVIRFGINTIRGIEIGRILAVTTLILFTTGLGITSIIKKLLQGRPLLFEHRALFYTLKFDLIHKTMEDLTSKLIAGMWVCGQAATSITIFMSVKSWGRLPPLMSALFPPFSLTLLYMALLPLSMIKKAMERYGNYLTGKRNKYYGFRDKKNHVGCWYCLMWRAKRLIRVKCGNMFVIDRYAIILYLQSLTTWVTNAVLMVNFED